MGQLADIPLPQRQGMHRQMPPSASAEWPECTTPASNARGVPGLIRLPTHRTSPLKIPAVGVSRNSGAETDIVESGTSDVMIVAVVRLLFQKRDVRSKSSF
jgi:hypothetical protein